MADTEKANAAALKQIQDQLTTTESAKATAEEHLKAANDQLKTAKDEAAAAASKAKDELAQERAARQAAEQALHASPPPPKKRRNRKLRPRDLSWPRSRRSERFVRRRNFSSGGCGRCRDCRVPSLRLQKGRDCRCGRCRCRHLELLTATLSIGSDGEICPGSAEQCARCCCRAVNRSVHVTYKSVYRVIGADYVVPSACTERMRAATFLGHRYKLKRVQAFIEPTLRNLFSPIEFGP